MQWLCPVFKIWSSTQRTLHFKTKCMTEITKLKSLGYLRLAAASTIMYQLFYHALINPRMQFG